MRKFTERTKLKVFAASAQGPFSYLGWHGSHVTFLKMGHDFQPIELPASRYLERTILNDKISGIQTNLEYLKGILTRLNFDELESIEIKITAILLKLNLHYDEVPTDDTNMETQTNE